MDPSLVGENAIQNAAQYWMSFSLGPKEIPLEALIDTQSSSLIINNKDIYPQEHTVIGNIDFLVNYKGRQAKAVRTRESLNLYSSPYMRTSIIQVSNQYSIPNVLGLGYANPEIRPQEGKIKPIIDQLANEFGYKNIFSLKLCGIKSASSVLIGGIDKELQYTLGNFLNTLDKTSLTVPITTIRRADNKKILGTFDDLEKDGKYFSKARIDSSTTFTSLPASVLEAMIAEIINDPANSGMQFPLGFFRAHRGSTIKIVRFPHLKKIRQFPSFELGFLGVDGQEKFLIMSPEHYFKEMDSIDTLVRTFGFRVSIDEVTLGQSFIENYYLFVDRNSGLIGFGDINKACRIK